MRNQDFAALYVAGLQEARGLEEMLIQAMPRLIEAAEDRDLVETLRAHLTETRKQHDRVRELAERNGASGTAPRDPAIAAMIATAEASTLRLARGDARDAMLIALAQRIAHYEVAVYGTLAAYAKTLGRHDEKRVLAAILEEERAADDDLSDVAVALVDPPPVHVAA